MIKLISEKTDKTADQIVKNLTVIPASTNPNDADCLDPYMEFTCLWCGKLFCPYNQMVKDDYAFMSFCSPRHCYLYKKYGKIKNFFDNIPRYLYHKPIHAIYSWIFKVNCPLCHKRMEMLFKKELYTCVDCFHTFKVDYERGTIEIFI